MSNTMNSHLNKTNYQGDNTGVSKNLIKPNAAQLEPPQDLDSLLCLDNTILRGIEDNIDDDDKFSCHRNDGETLGETESKEKDSSTTIPSTSNEEATQWQDNTFLNEAFSQFNSTNDNDILECLDQDVINQGPDQELCLVDENLQHSNLLKRNSVFINDVIPTKKHCLNFDAQKEQSVELLNKTEHNNSFYGLPDGVKKLILQNRGINALYEWQDECLSLEAIKNRKNLIYALPTSGGKTLVAEILMLKELICNKKNAIFILPFVAIVQEKVQSMAPFALELHFLLEEYAAAKGVYPPKKRHKKNSIYMCTIEKALGLVNSLIDENRLNEIGIVVVDELHLLGESGGRGATLEVILTKLLYTNEHIHIVGMSATIGNLNDIAQFLNADLYTGNFRPIKIKEYVKCEDNIWLVDLKTEELLTDLKKINYRYSDDAAVIDPDRIGGLVMDVVPNDSCLVFCSSRKNCENVALLLSKLLSKSMEIHKADEKRKLLNALKTEEGLCPTLQKSIKMGIAYHHSGLTSEERRLLEDAFKAGILCVICCTSTLAAGVNLPARRVILRSPYVGNQFLNISKYKQMIGRAGRTGMGNIGESILICKRTELAQVRELLPSKMDDSLSTLHIEKDRGINNLILSATLLRIGNTRSELHKIVAKTLLSVQQKRLNTNVKKVADDAITEFLKRGVMKTKAKRNTDNVKSNLSIVIPSQDGGSKDKYPKEKKKQVVIITNETELELCDLGRAAMRGSINMECAHTLYQDLKTAQKHIVLIDYLHLLYLVTPYDILSQVKPVSTVYYDMVTNLSEEQMTTARVLGITESTAYKLRDGLFPKNVEPRVVHRFYVTLILYELWSHHAVYSIAEKFQISRGIVQNLLTAASSFSSSVVRFCQELDEFSILRDVLNVFSKKLSYCCPLELEMLMELPLVKIGRARQLHKAGYTTVQLIAKANPVDLQNSIPYLSKSAVGHIIEAAKLLIIKRMEDLRDDAEDILDGIDIYTLQNDTYM